MKRLICLIGLGFGLTVGLAGCGRDTTVTTNFQIPPTPVGSNCVPECSTTPTPGSVPTTYVCGVDGSCTTAYCTCSTL